MVPIVRMQQIVKRYAGVLALDHVDFELFPGEVHIVAGENGAGKSTLMKVLAGSVQADSGRIEIAGKPALLHSPLDAMRAGISAVYQEFALCPHLSAAENIFLGREPGGRFFVNKRDMHKRAGELLRQLGAVCGPEELAASLGTAQLQLVEIARALNSEFRVLILDEPTAPLSELETAVLFKAVRALRSAGKTVVYISHRLEEFAELGDRVTVMRNGKCIETLPVKDASIPRLINAMAGKDMSELFPPREKNPGAPVLRVSALAQGTRLNGISFELRAGEILGVAGLAGSGRTRLLRTLFGLESETRGRVELGGRDISRASVRQRIAAGIGLVPEDRKTQGLLLDLSIAKNISIANLEQLSRGPLVSAARERRLAETQSAAAKIKMAGVEAAAGSLSGGNQQKVVLAKWLARDCRVLLLDEPARGVDVGARYEIFKLVAACAAAGRAVLLVSSYLPELLGMCDRILVLHRGGLAGEFPAQGTTQEQLLHAASVGATPGMDGFQDPRSPRTAAE